MLYHYPFSPILRQKVYIESMDRTEAVELYELYDHTEEIMSSEIMELEELLHSRIATPVAPPVVVSP